MQLMRRKRCRTVTDGRRPGQVPRASARTMARATTRARPTRVRHATRAAARRTTRAPLHTRAPLRTRAATIATAQAAAQAGASDVRRRAARNATTAEAATANTRRESNQGAHCIVAMRHHMRPQGVDFLCLFWLVTYRLVVGFSKINAIPWNWQLQPQKSYPLKPCKTKTFVCCRIGLKMLCC